MHARAVAFGKALQSSRYGGAATQGSPRVTAVGYVCAPSAPQPPLAIPLSLVDAELYRVFGGCSGALFFRERLDEGTLRQALSSTLSAFPVLAGRVVTATGGVRNAGHSARGGPFVVDCCNAGAAFTTLHCPSVALPEDRAAAAAAGGGGGELTPFPAVWDIAPIHVLADDGEGALMDVCLVFFATGSALIINISHAIADGVSVGLFMQHWAGVMNGQPPPPPPTLDRAVYDAACGVPSPAPPPPPPPPQQQQLSCGLARRGSSRVAPIIADALQAPEPAADAPTPPAAAAHKRASRLPRSSPLGGVVVWPSAAEWARIYGALACDSSLGAAPGAGRVVRLVLPLPRAALARLKAAAAAGAAAAGCPPDEAARLSSNDAASALLWRALSAGRRRCLGPSGRGGGDETLCFTACTRRAVLPPERVRYIGNATVVVPLPPMRRAALAASSLGELAVRVRAAKAAVTPQAVRDEMAFVAAHAAAGRHLVRWHTLPLGGRTICLDWSMPLGQGQRFAGALPFYFEPMVASKPLPYLVGLMAAADGDGLTVHVHLPGDEAQLFLRHMRVILNAL